MRKFHAIVMMLSLVGAPAFSQSGAPMQASEYEMMQKMGPKRAVMLAACDGNIPMAALSALEKANLKATVFVSAKSLSKDKELASLLAKRSDLFEVGNLGAACIGRNGVLDGVVKAARANKLEGEKERSAVESLARNLVEGSAAIEKRLGRKPKFFAFGLDFNNTATDPYDQNKMLVAISEYLAKPTPASRYDILASSKAGFDAWVLLVKMDRGAPGPLGGNKSYSEDSISSYLTKNASSFTSKKASEAWKPGKRAYLAKELGSAPR